MYHCARWAWNWDRYVVFMVHYTNAQHVKMNIKRQKKINLFDWCGVQAYLKSHDLDLIKTQFFWKNSFDQSNPPIIPSNIPWVFSLTYPSIILTIIFSIFPEYSLNIPWSFPEYFPSIPSIIPWVFPQAFTEHTPIIPQVTSSIPPSIPPSIPLSISQENPNLLLPSSSCLFFYNILKVVTLWTKGLRPFGIQGRSAGGRPFGQ